MNYCWILLLMIHCSRGQDRYKAKCLNREEVIPKKYLIMKDESLPIKLDTSSRITHQLSTQIFKIYIKEVLGYPKVVINNYEDDFQIEEVMERLSESENKVPPATINLEVWASADYDTLAKELVKESGNVAAPGRFGWFVPLGYDTPIREYYQRYRWSDAIREVHWSFFTDPKFAARFDIDDDIVESLIEANDYNREHAENGEYVCPPSHCKRSMYVPSQCKKKSCAMLLAPQFNSSRFLIDQIEETDVLVKVLWLGDNLKRTISDLKHAYQMSPKKGILIFHWYPSDIVPYQEKFISVQFKNNELYNFTHKNTTGFKYEIHRLVKMSWGKVHSYAYPLYVGLRHFKLEEKDFHWLLSTYNGFPEMSIEQIACEWMKNNNDTWEQWKVTTRKATLYIGGIFPISSTSYNGSSILQASHLASQAVNRDNTTLPDYDLKVLGANGKCSPDTVMNEFINFVRDHEYYSKLVGVLGPACSETVEPIAGVSKHYHIIVISYSAEGSSFSDRKTYPYFFRTIGENQHYKHVYLSLFKYFHWQRVAALTEDGQKYTEYIALMQEDFEKQQIEFIANKKFPREKKNEDMRWHLEDLKNKRARIIIADVVDDAARTVMCEAYKLEMTAKQGYVWFLPVWLNKTWYDTDLFNVIKKDHVNCTTKEMIEAINGYFSLTHSYYAPDETMMQENMSVGMWRKKHYNMVGGSPYAGFAYDAVWTYALALDKLASADSEAMSTLHSENSTNKLVRLIEATDFQGVSGRIKFRGGPSRFSVINIMQWYNNESHLVGYFNPNLTDNKPEVLGGILQLNNSAVMWFTKDGSVPEDGNLPPPTCAVQSLANAFDVECQTAMIILNVIVAGILLIIVVAVCYYMKREYDKKVERTKNYIRSLGLTLEINYTDLDKWEVSRENVVINRKLGEGAFGTVYGGEALFPERGGWMAVAVKTLKVGSSSVEKLDFLSEAEAMKRFSHKNIVTLLGVCTKDEPVYTIMEFMLYGDLKVYLLGRRNLVNSKDSEELEEVSPKRLTNMALDVALGLKYLAEMKYVHRDIASRNCLVNAQRCVKIGDFGMTRAMFENDYYKFTRKGMLPVRWMSPESLDSGVFSSASDMWSYGVLLYEIITFGSFPFQGKSNAEVLDLVKDKQTLSVPKGAKPLLEGLMKSCWRHEPKERPTAAQIVDLLANNPRLLSPCLDAPTSSVPIEHDQLDMSPQKDAKIVSPSKSMNGALIQASKSIFEDRHEAEIPLEVCCPKEPLLGPTSTSSLLTLGSRKEPKHDEKDDYVNQHLTVRKQNTNV